jgi:thiol reductant ABC exporter CydC subunit
MTRQPSPPATLISLLALRDQEPTRAFQAVALGVTSQVATLGLLTTSAWLITTASLRPPVLTLTVAIAAVQLFALLRGTARYGERLASHDLALRVLGRLRAWAYAHIEPMVPARWPGARRGDLLARFVSDVDGVQDLYVRALIPLATATVTAIMAILTATLLLPAAGLVIGAGLLVGIVVSPLASLALAERDGSDTTALRGDRDALIVEALHGSAELAVFGADHRFIARLEVIERDLDRRARRSALATSLAQTSATALGGLVACAVIIVSLPSLRANHVDGVTVAVLAFLALASADIVSTLPEAFARLATTLRGAKRVLAIESSDPALDHEGKLLVPTPPTRAAGLPVGNRANEVPPVIAFHNVAIVFDPSRPPALDRFDLHLAAGRHIAIIGPSGAGKTTIAHTLLHFVEPNRGSMTYDGIGSKRFDPDDLRRLIAWAPQRPHLFRTSLAANMRVARPAATDADIVTALDCVGLGAFLADLPLGLDTIIGERASTVSGGELQRIGVARALLASRPVLLLDEPTANLDPGQAEQLQAAVLAAAATKTLIWITHQYEKLNDFHEVIQISGGRIVPTAANDL